LTQDTLQEVVIPLLHLWMGETSYDLTNIEGEIAPEEEEFSAKVQIRKAGEKRYSKGKIQIGDSDVHLTWKKFLGSKQEISFAREEVESVGFQERGVPVEIAPPGPKTRPQWLTLEIQLTNGESYTIYVGLNSSEEAISRFIEIQSLLSVGDGSGSTMGKLRNVEEWAAPEVDGPSISHQLHLSCPHCGVVDTKYWYCPQCQEEQPYYVGGRMHHVCPKCGYNKEELIPDPELLCPECFQYAPSSEWKPA